MNCNYINKGIMRISLKKGINKKGALARAPLRYISISFTRRSTYLPAKQTPGGSH